MIIADLIITLGYIALVTLVLGVLAYATYAIVPFVKAFFKWHFHD